MTSGRLLHELTERQRQLEELKRENEYLRESAAAFADLAERLHHRLTTSSEYRPTAASHHEGSDPAA